MNRSPATRHVTLAACAFLVSTGLTASAAVITNPTLVSGASTSLFDPTGSEEVDASGSGATSQSDIENLTTARALQSFSGISTASSAAGWVHTISFTDTLLPDLRLTASGSSWRNNSTGAAESNALRATSGASNIRMIANNNTTVPIVMRIDFGNYDTTTTTFNPSTNAVSAAGVTLSNLVSGLNAVVSFYTDADVLLSSQSASGADSDTTTAGGADVYFGFKSTSANIGYVLVSKAQAASGTNKSQIDVGLDDIVFTTVPEPASLSLLALGGLGLLRRRRS